ncbi:MAG: type II toxin-antitoxin system RelE/ParE family toxin [Sphingobacteriaceae bacterium]|nr:type II toxin-antitoxin system RelE/ParE family toxin [Sphingobacteriaceae bacterium]
MKALVWTPIALKSLQETVDFLNLTWNSQVVEAFIDLLEEKLDLIQANPEIAPKIGNQEIRRLLIHPTVSLFYELNQDYLKVLLVWDNRQNPDSFYKRLMG